MTKKNIQWHKSTAAFTLVEVGIAVLILGLVVASSITAMRSGFAMIETARNNGLASQILQSEMEILRLKNWQDLVVLTDGEFELEGAFKGTVAENFQRHRSVEEISSGLIQVTLDVSWKGATGNTLSRRYVSFFSHSGLNDYYYRKLPK